MERLNYFSIHNHTEYSNLRLLDSINKPYQLIDRALQHGLKGICITDHEILSGHISFLKHYNSIKEEHPDFKIGLGNEIYLVDERKREQQYYHFLLVAKNANGHQALRELSSKAWYGSYHDRGMERVPTTYGELEEVIAKYPGSLIGTTACLGGYLPSLVKEYRRTKLPEVKEKIIDFISYMKKLFGNDFYIEIAPSQSPDQIVYNKFVMQIKDQFEVKVVMATDSHYLGKDNRFVHKSYLNSKHGDREVDAFYEYSYLMSPQEAYDNLIVSISKEEALESMRNTYDIYDKIEIYNLAKTQEIPLEEVKYYEPIVYNRKEYPSLGKMLSSENDQNRYWANECLSALKELGKENDEYLKRIDTEADVILDISDKLNQPLSAYFNTFKSYIDLFWEQGSIVGPGRGSAVGFLSNFLLGITQIDPVKYNLPWFRFLNKERAELPDIDIDLAPSKRLGIFESIRKKKGELRLLQVATFGTEGTKSSALTACRGYRSEEYPDGIDVDVAQYLTSLIPSERGFLWSLSDVVNGNAEKERKPIREFLSEVQKYPGLLDIMLSIEGLVNKRSQHASGVVLYNDEPYLNTAIMRSPSGDLTTQFSLYDVEYMGGTKFDFLVTEITDKITAAVGLLQKDGLMPKEMSLRELYNKYLHPESLPLTDQRIWNALSNNEVLDAFQFNTPVGGQAAKMVKAQNIHEMTSANALMRLMGEKGQDTPLEKYVKYKNNPDLWIKEMVRYGLTKEEQEIVAPYYKKEYGVPPYQESIMLSLMDKNIANFSLKDSNGARKIVAKKKMDQIDELKKKVYDSIPSKNLANYIWDTCVAPQLGYGFSELHSLAYSFVGVQTLYLATSFPNIYWNTSCLIVNAGMIDHVENQEEIDEDEDDDNEELNEDTILRKEKIKNSSTDYAKLATAMGKIISSGITISKPNVNKSEYGFKPDAENNEIIYGLASISNLGEKPLSSIIANRPYVSIEDFKERTIANKTVTLNLIKGGAFDSMYPEKSRMDIMADYIKIISAPKKRLTLQNFNGIIEKEMVPDRLSFEVSVYKFTKVIRKHFKRDLDFIISENEQVMGFYQTNFDMKLLHEKDGEYYINQKTYEKLIYNPHMDKVRAWLKSAQEELLYQYNHLLFEEEWNKYCSGNISSWEMDSISFYYHEHELEKANLDEYGIKHFSDLPEIPTIESFWQKGRLSIPIYNIHQIVGTVISKDKTKSTINLLTTNEVVTIRFRKEMFAAFDKQLSVLDESTGKKKIVEKSWFKKGSKIMVSGFRRDDQFVPKTYARTPWHTLYKIDEIKSDGSLVMRYERGDY